VSAVDELLTWWMTGPVGHLLASSAGVPAIATGCVAVLAVEVVCINDGDRLSAAAKTAAWHGLVTAALLVAVHLPAGTAVHR
jgi:hypothetical protein